MLSLVLLSTLLCISAVFGTVVTVPRLPIETHSFNDLDIWPQLLRKGVRYIKTDISYCIQQSCLEFSTFNTVPGRGTLDDCFVGQDGQTYCCMCIRGDASTRPDLFSPFNTTADLVAFFSDPSRISAGYIPRNGDPNPLMFGLDFGGVSVDFFNTTENALLLTFLFNLQQVIASNNLSVIPYFDAGTSGWFQELDQKCFAGQCSGWEIKAQQIPWPSEAGDALPPQSQDPYNRYAILNSDEDDLQSDCNSSSWNSSLQKASKYPYLWYEPSSQIEYLGFFDFWKTCPTVPSSKRNPNEGVVVVSNQATEMFETYASSAIGRGMNALVLPNNFKNPRVSLLASCSSQFDRALLLIVTNNQADGANALVYGVVDGETPQQVLQNLTIPMQAVSHSTWNITTRGDALLTVANASGVVMQYVWNVSTCLLRYTQTTSLKAPAGTSLLASKLACLTENNTCWLTNLWGNDTGTYFGVTGVSGSTASPVISISNTAVANGADIAWIPSDNNSFTGIVIYSTGAASPQGVEQAYSMQLRSQCYALNSTTACELLQQVAAPDAVVMEDVRPELYGVVLQLNATKSGIATVSASAQSQRIGFGANPGLHTYRYNGIDMLLETHTHGSCQCGLLMNNDDTPHCLIPSRVSDSNPVLPIYQSVPYLLNYNYGKAAAFADLLSGAYSTATDQYLGMCHSEIMSGKFENGASVSAALYVRQVQYVNTTEAPNGGPVDELTLLAAHDGDVICPIVTTIVCGSPLPKNGVVIDQFRLVQPSGLP